MNKSGVNLVAKPQKQSTFLELPREIRDQIYIQVLSEQWIVLTCGDAEVLASGDKLPDLYQACDVAKDLPQWVSTCKQVTIEAIEVVLRTRSLEPMDIWGHFDIVPNSLVFGHG
jgi:hypothetical protein